EEKARDAKSPQMAEMEKRLASAREGIPRITTIERIPEGVRAVFRNGTGDARKMLSDLRKQAQQDLKVPKTATDWNLELKKNVLERNFGLLGIEVQWKQPLIWGITLGLMLALEFLIRKTMVGRAMRAVALDQNTAALMG